MAVPGNNGPCGGTGKGEDQRGFQCDAVNILLPLLQEGPGISSGALGELTAEWAQGKKGSGSLSPPVSLSRQQAVPAP